MLAAGVAAVLAGLAVVASPAAARDAFVVNDGDISVVDTDTNTKVGADIPVSNGVLDDVAITPDGTRAYVTDISFKRVSVIDTIAKTKLAATIPVGTSPRAIAITPDGKRAYVVNELDDDVSVIDTTTNKKVGTDIPVGEQPQAIAITPDGTRAYVANTFDNDVSVINTATNTKVGADIPVAGRPVAIAINPTAPEFEEVEHLAYVVNSGDDDTLSLVGIKTNEELGSLPLGSAPSAIAITPDGKQAYVADLFDNNVTRFDASFIQDDVGIDIPVGDIARAIAIRPDGKRAYIANGGDDDISVIDTATNTKLPNDIAVGDHPTAIAIVPNQPPIASMSVSRGAVASGGPGSGPRFVAEVGEPLVLDAAASFDPDGQLEEYEWEFGDGATASGPAVIYSYTAPGTYTAALTLTDDEGCSSELVFTGQTALCNGSAAATATETVEVLAAPGLELSAKKKQKPNKLKLKASCGELPCSAKISGKASVPAKGKAKRFRLKPKTADLEPGKTKKIRLAFKGRKSAKQIAKLLGGKKARKRNRLVAKVKATGPAGGTDGGKAKIKLKR